MMKKLVVLIVFIFVGSGSALAADFSIPGGTAQSTFNSLVTEAARLTAYRSMMPAEPGGWTGFDVGIAFTGAEIDSTLWQAFISDNQDTIAIPRLMVQKGLPGGIDIGAFYAEVDDYDISMEGAQIQWALLEGTAATPALSLRGSYTKLDAGGEMEVKTTAADIVVSKGIAMLTPYAGVGVVGYEGTYEGTAVTLNDFDDDENRIFAGVQFAIALLNITAEYEKMEEPVYSLKFSLGW